MPAKSLPSLTLTPIGVIHTPYSDRYRAPRQPGLDEKDCQATIVLRPGCNFEQALDDLQGFEMIWILSWFHRNPNWKPKVLPPRGPRKKRGVFATRSPHRPNPLGLSAVRLLEVRGRTLRIGATDLLDGTPVLDIKPYLPYADAFPGARAGWLDDLPANAAHNAFRVEWSALAARQSEWLAGTHGIDLAAEATPILARDPQPHPYRRISRWNKSTLLLALKSWRVRFSVQDDCVSVERIVSGYALSAVQEKGRAPLYDEAAHADFHRQWPEYAGARDKA